MPTTQVRPLAIGGLIVPVLAFSLYLTYTYIVRYLRQREFKTEHGCKPVLKRFAAKDPILGSDWILGNLKSAREHQYLNTLAKRYDDAGTTFATRVLSTRAICTIDPENIKTVLSLRFQDYSIGNRPRIMGPLLGKGIFTTDGKDWAHSRALLRPCFVKEEQNADLEKHFGNLLELLPRDGSTVDLQPLFFRYTLDTATEFLFGRSVHSLLGGAEADKVFADNFTTSLGELAYRIRMGPFLFLRRNKEADIAFRACRDYVEEFVQEALGVKSSLRSGDFENGGKDLFLRELAKSVNDPERIKDELLNILIAGRDTTASLLSHALMQISRHPHVMARLRQDLARLGNSPPTYSQLRDMKYLRYVLQETLRLYPPVPTNVRLATTDTVLPVGGGAHGDEPIFVAQGSLVVYTVYAMHRRKDFFGPDADFFKPERWENSRFSWEYLPFNGGPRICLGQQYAMTEAAYVIVRLLQEFSNIESRDSEPWAESLTLTVCSKNGVKVGLTGK